MFKYERQLKSEYNQNRLSDMYELDSIIDKNNGQDLFLLSDYRILTLETNLDKGINRLDLFNNFSDYKKNSFDFILLSEENPIFKSDLDIKMAFSNPEKYLDGAIDLRKLLKTGSFGNDKYAEVYRNSRIIVFKNEKNF
jgi:hypothetical protein